MPLTRIDHVQLAMPPGGEDAARGFYAGLLGLEEVAKPAELAGRGGSWFELGSLRLHLGVEADFRPARKAHPALRVEGFAELVSQLRKAGCAVSDQDRFEGSARVYVEDPFGNRIELIADA
jgi:catechol 2,3-dioxygenase-like lactoylglutathione lyase family enzyme